MSAFICNYEVIDNILSIVDNCDWLRKDCFIRSELKEFFGTNPQGCITPEILSNIGKEFLKLNIKSVNYRYSENTSNKYANSYKYKFRKVPIIQSLKSLHCLMYQSCEIPNYTKNKTYKKMKELEKILVNSYIHSCKEYRDAAWG